MKSFEFNGEELGCVVHLNSINGPLAIDIGNESLTLAAAKRFRKWLDEAIAHVEADQKNRKVRLEQRGNKRTIVIG